MKSLLPNHELSRIYHQIIYGKIEEIRVKKTLARGKEQISSGGNNLQDPQDLASAAGRMQKKIVFPQKKRHKKRSTSKEMLLERWAATYFSTNKCSIISEGGLNFSVRNGKR